MSHWSTSATLAHGFQISAFLITAPAGDGDLIVLAKISLEDMRCDPALHSGSSGQMVSFI